MGHIAKKIGIITIVKVNNYGAELQAYALQKFLSIINYESEIIDYLFYKNPGHKRERISYPFFKFPLKRMIKERMEWLYVKIMHLIYQKRNAKRNRAFDSFHRNHTVFSEKTYGSYSMLYANPPFYNVYCVGSDQVWNPYCYTSLFPYFLTFVPKGAKKISYASSFGVSNIPKCALDTYKKCLDEFDHISVRENTGKMIVQNLIGKDVPVVADPTILISKEGWMEIAKTDKVPMQPYILIYMLKDSPFILKEAQRIAKSYGACIVRIRKDCSGIKTKGGNIIDIWDAGPDDFLGLFSQARMVITNSFHGTVFSVIMKKDFCTVLPRENERNSRQKDFLHLLGLERNLFYENDEINITATDYRTATEQLNKLRQNSIKQLIHDIEN